MDLLWAPWRMQYIRMQKPEGCFLCQNPAAADDDTFFILHRGRTSFVIMNTYPYTPGHLLVAPFRHIASFEDMTTEELLEHFELVRRCITVLREAFSPAGFNLGANLGKVAGAGLDDHVHTHIVPRWQGDNNFMPVLADTRVVHEAIADTYRQLKGRF